MKGQKVKHHSLAHWLLIIILYFLSSIVFGGWEQGPLTSGLVVGANVYALFNGAASGDVAGASVASLGVLQLLLVFVINLFIYYAVAAMLLFLWNLVFGKK